MGFGGIARGLERGGQALSSAIDKWDARDLNQQKLNYWTEQAKQAQIGTEQATDERNAYIAQAPVREMQNDLARITTATGLDIAKVQQGVATAYNGMIRKAQEGLASYQQTGDEAPLMGVMSHMNGNAQPHTWAKDKTGKVIGLQSPRGRVYTDITSPEQLAQTLRQWTYDSPKNRVTFTKYLANDIEERQKAALEQEKQKAAISKDKGAAASYSADAAIKRKQLETMGQPQQPRAVKQ